MTSSTCRTNPQHNETIDVFYIKKKWYKAFHGSYTVSSISATKKSFPKQVLRMKFTVFTRKLHGLGNDATALRENNRNRYITH